MTPPLTGILVACSIMRATDLLATITSYDQKGEVSHSDTRYYADLSLLWEHIGCQQNNRRTRRVHVQTDSGLEYEVILSPWTPSRRYSPSRRFQALLMSWGGQLTRDPEPR